jgi:hypothetical protein
VLGRRGDGCGVIFRDVVLRWWNWGFSDRRSNWALSPPGETTSYAAGAHWLEILAAVEDLACVFWDLGLPILAAEHLSEAAVG